MTNKMQLSLSSRLKRLLNEDNRVFLSALWRRLMIRTTVIAISGSMGKTTTKEILSMALATKGLTLKTKNNENGTEGVARTLRNIRPWHRYAVIEIGTDTPGSMRKRATAVRPDIAIMLCVAATHQNNFHNLDNTATEKSELIRSLRSGGTAILNRDDPRVLEMSKLCAGKVIYFGTTPDADYIANNSSYGWPESLSFDFSSPKEKTRINTQLIGSHWQTSVSAALAAASSCGVPLSDSSAMVARTKPFASRMQPLTVPNGPTFVRDDSHGSVTAFDAMFSELIAARAPRKGLVISDHTDSKKTPKQRFRKLGKLAAEHCDFVVFTGDHSHHGHNAAVSAGMDPKMCPAIFGVQQISDWLKTELGDGDLVFVKGRMTDHLTRVVFAQFGDIDCWKNHCPIRYGCDFCSKLKPSFDLAAIMPSVNIHPNLIISN